jgi:hypothetical protein
MIRRLLPRCWSERSMQMVLPDYATRFDTLSLSACFLDLKGVGETPRQATEARYDPGKIRLKFTALSFVSRQHLKGRARHDVWDSRCDS